ncbi:TD and POZ domain-containing protein 3 [Araneus ventricosus]|uniref:TD and POZ domain-containing protein 3 n=1 Tax=Araneus ventricosus TaxID=182803 RepID=A0A4Y2GPX1_ARAVE|nr:TD and POZ domain-containing protein 3 [Araneus ventricosus]
MGQNISALNESQVDHGCYKAYKFEYKWTISNFNNLATKNAVGYCTTSPSLSLNVEDKTNSFNLMLYSNGYNERVKDYLSVYLKKNSTNEMLIQFTCAVLDSNDKEINAKSIKQKMSLESHLGWITYCRRDFLLDNETKILIDGILTLNCTLEIFENKAIMNAETEDGDPCMDKSQSKISEDLNHLLLEGDFSDVTFKVDGKDFPVHKAILSARSAVFKTMLKSQLQANSKEINISDIKAETVKEMLHYIYSGDVGYIDVQTAQELYYASDKYELHGLKNICNKILVRKLDTNNAIDILLLGHKHSDNDLKYTSIEFIAKNAPEIQEKKEWVLLMKNYSELANMVFKYLSKKS